MSRDFVFKKFEENRDFVNARVNYGIECYRKGTIKAEVVDKDGKPIPEANVSFSQKNHEFKYGANIFMLDEFETEEKNQIYREEFKNLFNIATLPFYWSDLEPEKGNPRFSKGSKKVYRRPAPDLCLEYCRENAIEAKEHCLVYEPYTPDWLKNQSLSEIKKYMEIRFAALAERYADKIPSWEVINETICQSYVYGENQPLREMPDIIEWSFKLAEKYFPQNRLIINEASPLWHNFFWDRSQYYMQIERALKNGARIDSVGMQFHMFLNKEDEEKSCAEIFYDPIRLYKVMDQYAKFGKPLQITELTIPAYSNSAYDEDIQAELIKRLYEIWFSHPAMEAIIYWNLVDGYAAFAPMGDMSAGENYYHGGLMDFNMRKKPAFDAIRDLFGKKWHTEGREKTDANGIASFRGFFGDYDLTVTANGKTVPAKIFASKNNAVNKVKIVVE